MDANNYAARWTGFVRPWQSGTYFFHCADNFAICNIFVNGTAVLETTAVVLQSNRNYRIKSTWITPAR